MHDDLLVVATVNSMKRDAPKVYIGASDYYIVHTDPALQITHALSYQCLESEGGRGRGRVKFRRLEEEGSSVLSQIPTRGEGGVNNITSPSLIITKSGLVL